jgi:hypothetical protein
VTPFLDDAVDAARLSGGTHHSVWLATLATPAGSVAVIDPAVSWCWPETDVSMMLFSGPSAPDRFFAAYHEVRPAEPGWRDHLLLLHLRELLCLLSQGARPARPRPCSGWSTGTADRPAAGASTRDGRVWTATYPRGIFQFVEGVARWHSRVVGYALTLVTDVYPPFRLAA